MRLLLESGTDKDLAMNAGVMALFMASQNGHLEVVRLLLESGAEKDLAMNERWLRHPGLQPDGLNINMAPSAKGKTV